MSRRRWAGALGLALLAACGGDEGPVGGDITVSLSTALPQTGALLIRITGPIEDLAPVGNLRVASAAIAGVTATRVVVTGTIGPGDLLRLTIPDLAAFGSYAVMVEQAAAGTDFSLLDPAAFSLTLRR